MSNFENTTLNISLPDSGQSRNIALSSDVSIQLDFNLDNAVFVSKKGNLEITLEDRGTIILVGYQALVESESLPVFINMDGEEAKGYIYPFIFESHDVNAEVEIKTTVGGTAGAGVYSDEPGQLASGFDSLDSPLYAFEPTRGGRGSESNANLFSPSPPEVDSPANNAPEAQPDFMTLDEDTTNITGQVTAIDVDQPVGINLNYALNEIFDASPEGLTFNTDGSWSFDANSYDSLENGQSQTFTVGYTATDNQGATDDSFIEITVNGVNENPEAFGEEVVSNYDGLEEAGLFLAADVEFTPGSGSLTMDGITVRGVVARDVSTEPWEMGSNQYSPLTQSVLGIGMDIKYIGYDDMDSSTFDTTIAHSSWITDEFLIVTPETPRAKISIELGDLNDGETARVIAYTDDGNGGFRQLGIPIIAAGDGGLSTLVTFDEIGGDKIAMITVQPLESSDFTLVSVAAYDYATPLWVDGQTASLEFMVADVLANDIDADHKDYGDGNELTDLTITILGSVGGTAQLVGDRIVFDAAADFDGTGSVTYVVNDPLGGVSEPAILTIRHCNVAPTIEIGIGGDAIFQEAGVDFNDVTHIGSGAVSILGGHSIALNDVDDLPEVATVTIQNTNFISGDIFDVSGVDANLFTVSVDNDTGTVVITTAPGADYNFSDLQDAVRDVTFSRSGHEVEDGNRTLNITIADDHNPLNAIAVETVNIDVDGFNSAPNAIDDSINEIIVATRLVDNVLDAFSEFKDLSTHEVNNIKLTARSLDPWTGIQDPTAYFTHIKNDGLGTQYDHIGVGYAGDSAFGDAFTYVGWTPMDGYEQQDGVLIEFTDFGKETVTIDISGQYVEGHVALRINGTDCGTINQPAGLLVFKASDYNVESIHSIEFTCEPAYSENHAFWIPRFYLESITVDSLEPVLSVESVTGDVLSNDFDIDGDALNVTLVNGTAIDQTDGVDTLILGTYGDLHIGADGEYSFVMHAGWENLTASVTESFEYTVSDGNGGTDLATLDFPIHVEANEITELDAGSATTMTGTGGEDLIYIADTASVVTLGEGADTIFVDNDYINSSTQDVTISGFNTNDAMVLDDLIDQTMAFAEADNGNDLVITITNVDGVETNEVVITLDDVTLNGITPVNLAGHFIDISSNHESLDSLIQQIVESPEHNS
ncbi:Ig-like domain-containing protein [uncultured Pseudodesulfovibrio sp.]|uniref:Ig-like domain-containing protein n=1 Tax=uncultured Pseudodesulfovibrio sp. TaxID=2035858 RepID=UPI0029C7AA7B|nr:Ig-like domain-containing protein [uncultured Pseudodesulfovibrio sp.]